MKDAVMGTRHVTRMSAPEVLLQQLDDKETIRDTLHCAQNKYSTK